MIFLVLRKIHSLVYYDCKPFFVDFYPGTSAVVVAPRFPPHPPLLERPQRLPRAREGFIPHPTLPRLLHFDFRKCEGEEVS